MITIYYSSDGEDNYHFPQDFGVEIVSKSSTTCRKAREFKTLTHFTYKWKFESVLIKVSATVLILVPGIYHQSHKRVLGEEGMTVLSRKFSRRTAVYKLWGLKIGTRLSSVAYIKYCDHSFLYEDILEPIMNVLWITKFNRNLFPFFLFLFFSIQQIF